MNKKITIVSAAVLTIAAATFAVPSVFAQTTSTVKNIGRNMIERGAGMHKGPFDNTKFLEEQASMLGITVDDLKARMESGKSFKDIATDLGISEETLQAKMEEARTAHQAEMKAKVQQEVTDGKITQAQADERIANMEKGPQGEKGNRPEGRGPGEGRGMKDETKMLETHASMLGITVDDLKARMESGKSLEDIAADLGISGETLQAKMEEARATHQAERKAEMTTKLQQDVTDGKITQAQADQMLANLENPKEHGFGEGRGRGFGRMMPGAAMDASAQ